MAERLRPDRLGWLALWLAVFAAALMLRILPQGLIAPGLPMPDLVLLLTLGWVLRRPADLPAPAIGLAWLVEDLLTLRPPGLWALMVLAGSEYLRARQGMVRELGLLPEWGLVAGVLVAMTLGYRLILALTFAPMPPLDLSLIRLAATIAAYPVAVLVLHAVLRVRKPATGELDELGRRL